MGAQTPSRPMVHLEVNTYDDLVANCRLWPWLEQARGLVAPFVSSGKGTTEPSLAMFPVGSATPQIRKLEEKSWGATRNRWAAGELRSIGLEFLMGRVNLEAEVGRPNSPKAASRVSLMIDRTLLPDPLPSGLQASLVELIKDGARALVAATAVLYVDRDLHPYEQLMGIHYRPATYERFRDRVRGYYWGNVLSARHVARLGGLERVLSEAPCFEVVDLDGAGELVYLQISAELDNYSDDQLRALRDFFAPVLPGGHADAGNVQASVRVFENGNRPDPDGIEPPTDSPPSPRLPIPLADAEELVVESTGSFEWDAAVFALYLDQPLEEAQAAELREAIASWAVVATYGGFGGPAHHVDLPSPTKTDRGTPLMIWSADLGAADQRAFDSLVAVIHGCCAVNGIGAIKLVFGHGADIEDAAR